MAGSSTIKNGNIARSKTRVPQLDLFGTPQEVYDESLKNLVFAVDLSDESGEDLSRARIGRPIALQDASGKRAQQEAPPAVPHNTAHSIDATSVGSRRGKKN